MNRFLLAVCLLCTTVLAQVQPSPSDKPVSPPPAKLFVPVPALLPAPVIEIKAPTTKQKNGKLLFLPIVGLDDQTRTKVKLDVEPKDDSYTAGQFGDVIVFEAEPKVDTKYTITLGLNEWRKGAETFFVSMKAAGVGKDVLDRQVAILTELETTHPYRYGTCVVEVAGSGPFSPIDPPPPPPNSKVTQVTYIFEKDQSSVPRPVSLALRRINVESSGSVVATEFEEDTVNASGQTPEQYKIALAEARKVGIPALVVQSGAIILRVLPDRKEAPLTEIQVMEAIK